MKLIDGWKEVLKKAWSVRLAALAAFFGSVPSFMPYLSDVFPAWFIGASIGFSAVAAPVIGAFVVVARVMDQGGLDKAMKDQGYDSY